VIFPRLCRVVNRGDSPKVLTTALRQDPLDLGFEPVLLHAPPGRVDHVQEPPALQD
jgi:hypothetical protein